METVMTIPLDQLVAWGMTIVAFTLFVVEKRRNVKEPVFMALQGFLKAVFVKYKHHKSHFGFLATAKHTKEDRPVTLDEYILYTQTVMADYEALMAHILGIMKSLGIEKEKIFDIEDFTAEKKNQAEWEQRVQRIIDAQK